VQAGEIIIVKGVQRAARKVLHRRAVDEEGMRRKGKRRERKEGELVGGKR